MVTSLPLHVPLPVLYTQVANDHFHDQSEDMAAVRSSGRGGAGRAPSARSTGLSASAGHLAGRVGRVPSENGGGVGRGSCIDPRYVQRFRSMSTLLNQRLPAGVNGGQSLGARYVNQVIQTTPTPHLLHSAVYYMGWYSHSALILLLCTGYTIHSTPPL